MEVRFEFKWSRTVLSAIIIGAAILGTSSLSSAQAINPLQQQIPLPGHPFAAITTPNGRYVFVSMTVPTSAVAVLRQRKTYAAVVQTIPTCGPAFGLAMSKGGRYLLAAVQSGGGSSCPAGGVQFIDVRKAIAGDPSAAMGTVATDPSAIEVAISPDNGLVFVANEFSGGQHCENPDTVSVIDFHKALSSGQNQSSVIGAIPVDCAPVGLAVSSNSRYLYVTNETALSTRSFYDPTACNIPDGPQCPITTHQAAVGTVDVADVRMARTDPANSLVAYIPAGCSPTRVILTNHDKVAWVSARDDNNLLAFNARDIRTNPTPAPLSTTPVGVAPDGAQPFSHRRFIAVANTNRFDSCPGAGGTVSILDFATALKSGGSAATVGTFDAGVFPRQWALSPNGKFLYLTEFSSDILAIFPVKSIVHQVK
jgi:DNA-binding beta-propeller fold protein YncE